MTFQTTRAMRAACAALVALSIVVAACGSDTTTTSDEAQATTTALPGDAPTTSAVAASSAPTTTAPPPTTTPPTTAPPTTATPTTAPPAVVNMPDVVCRNLQDAQNDIQHAGVFLSFSEDATGQGRNQIMDSNWLVVGQTPAPGTPIGEGDAVLHVVKYGESNPCGQ